MKYFAFLLAVFFLSLAVMPCTDGHSHTCEGESHDPTATHHHANKQGEPTSTSDHCTPLCICICCGITYTVPELLIFDTIDTPINALYNGTYTNNYTFTFHSMVWHPPAH